MRKLLLIAAILSSINLFAQKGTVLYENFSNGACPPTGWTIDAHSTNWSANTSNYSGGEAPEARFNYNPSFNGISRLISPTIDLTGVTSLRIQFKHSVDHYSGAYTLGFATTSDGTTWNDAWTMSGANVTESIDMQINTADVGSSTFQFCFYFSGNSYNIDYWYIDDILLYAPEQTDLALSTINIETYSIAGEQELSGSLFNAGIDEITSADINWKLNNNETVTQNVSGLSISTGESYDFIHESTITTTPGSHILRVWVSNINGSGNDDDNIYNNLLTKTLSVASDSTANLPLFEEFTSSTCAPCASFNASVFTPFLNNHPNHTLIKYQMNWPGSGDIYYTAEGGVRRTYYGVSYVPHLFTGGLSTESDLNGVTSAYNYETSRASYFEVNATHQINGTYISLQAAITPSVDAANFTVHAVVVENVTTGNVGSNGETEFHKVMMKMLPDANGTQIDFADGTPRYLFFDSIDLSSTNVEEFDDLSVVVFVQNDENKNVMQSAWSIEGIAPAPEFSTFPSNTSENTAVNENLMIFFTEPMRLINNDPISNANIADFVLLSDDSKANIPFTAQVNSDATSITIIPDAALPYDATITMTLENALENFDDVALTGGTIVFDTKEMPIAPVVSITPANSATNVSVNTTITFEFSQIMRLSDNTSITNDNVNTFIEIEADGLPIVYTASVNLLADKITITPSNALPFETLVSVNVLPLIENEEDIAIEETTISFTTQPESINELSNTQFNVYPNPAQNYLMIESKDDATIEIVNMIGEKIMEYRIESNLNKINISELTNGNYILRIKTSENKQTFPFTIAK